MINYKLFKENGFSIKHILNKNSVTIISDGNRKYAVKKCDIDLKNKLDYLKSRSFNNYPVFSIIGDYYVFDYIDDSNLSIEERLCEAVNLIAVLHMKTTRYKNIDIDDYKIIYENLYKKIKYLENYYLELNNNVDNDIYMRPSHYLLVLNISKIYSAFHFCITELNNWYDMVQKSGKQRLSFIHNNIDLSHILCNKHTYLISFDKAKIDIPIYDLISIYKKYYDMIDFNVLFNIYQNKYPLLSDELKLFCVIISIPFEINFSDDEINNVQKVKELINYVSSSDKFIKTIYDSKIKK